MAKSWARAAGAPPALGAGIRLIANENPYGPSPAALAAMRTAASRGAYYPGPERSELIGRIAAANDLAEEAVVVSSGSSEALNAACLAWGKAGRIVAPAVTFDIQLRYAERLGVTVVYVTHDQGEALTMSDRVAVFHQGEIQQIAPPRELYETPQNTFVAQFIGENNRLAGQLVSRDGEQCVVRLARGEQVKATAVNVGAVGEPVSLSIRPERIRLNGHSEACPNRFSGRIAEFIYLGDHVRIRMEVCGQSDFYVKQPVAELDPGLEVGDLVPLGWSVEHVRALDPLLAE